MRFEKRPPSEKAPGFRHPVDREARERYYRQQFDWQIIALIRRKSSGLFLTGVITLLLALINLGRGEVFLAIAQLVMGTGMILFVRSIGRIPARRSVIGLLLIFGISGLWNVGLALSVRLTGLGIGVAMLGAFQLWWAYQMFRVNQMFDPPQT